MELLKIKAFLLFLFSTLVLSAQADTISDFIPGEGRFYAQDDDSLSFVKKLLLYNAFKDVISKEMGQEGLNSKLFWEKYNQKFETYFAPVEEGLRKKFKITTDSDAIKNNEFQKELRLKKLNLESSFGNLKSAIHSYSISRMSRSAQIQNSRFIQIQAKLDKKKINSLYSALTVVDSMRSFDHLFLFPTFELTNLTWAEVGVEIKEDFTKVIQDHWQKWWEKKPDKKISEISIIDEGKEQTIRKFLRLPSKVTGEVLSPGGMGDYGISRNSLFMEIKISITKEQDRDLLGMKKFTINLNYVLIDLNSKNIIFSKQFPATSVNYKFQNMHELSSSLASYLYRLPLESFSDIEKNIFKEAPAYSEIELKVMNFKNISEVLSINELLISKGVTLHLNSRLEQYDNLNAFLNIQFIGNYPDLLKIISGLHDSNIGPGRYVQVSKADSIGILSIISRKDPTEIEFREPKESGNSPKELGDKSHIKGENEEGLFPNI